MRGITAAALVTLLAGCAADREPVCALPQGLPVFPGAEGFGSTTPAGRGGAVLAVTSLADEGPGTLRAAVSTSGPRIVVFRVAGTIHLRRQLEITEPFLTVAGQTAPGGGIQLADAGVVIFTHDVLLQHLRIRPGADGAIAADANDALTTYQREDAAAPCSVHDIVVDHCSLSWSEDEVVNIGDGSCHVTLSWSIAAEGLSSPRHPKGGHSAGVLAGNHTSCVSLHHNLMAHNAFRNPLLKAGGRHDVVNNLVYDWKDTATEIVPLGEHTEANIVGNVYRPGPESAEVPYEIVAHRSHPGHHFTEPVTLYDPAGVLRLFLQDNIGPHRGADNPDPYALARQGFTETPIPEAARAAEALDTAPITTLANHEVLELVLGQAGARRPTRDRADARVVDEVRTRRGGIIAHQDEVDGHEELAPGDPPPDRDHDGIADAWEATRGLDPDDPADGPADDDGDGYTNVEEYLHELGS